MSKLWFEKTLSYLNEVRQTFSNVIEQLLSRPDHNTLWDGVDLWLHLEITITFKMDQQYTEICAA